MSTFERKIIFFFFFTSLVRPAFIAYPGSANIGWFSWSSKNQINLWCLETPINQTRLEWQVSFPEEHQWNKWVFSHSLASLLSSIQITGFFCNSRWIIEFIFHTTMVGFKSQTTTFVSNLLCCLCSQSTMPCTRYFFAWCHRDLFLKSVYVTLL